MLRMWLNNFQTARLDDDSCIDSFECRTAERCPRWKVATGQEFQLLGQVSSIWKDLDLT